MTGLFATIARLAHRISRTRATCDCHTRRLAALGALVLAERQHHAATHAVADAITALTGVDRAGLAID
jgi:hypothetical protein